MKKTLLKFVNKLFSKPIVKVGIYILGIILIFFISGVFDDPSTSLAKIISILSAQETISVFLAGILSIGIAKFVKRCDYYLEESMKIDDDHHKIISRYSGHKKERIRTDENFVDAAGIFMCIGKEHTDIFRKSELKNREKDPYSKNFKIVEKAIETFKKGDLYLPSLNMFANIKGDTRLVFADKNEFHTLDDFVIDNAANLLAAHKNSKKRNNHTVRLNDFSYENGVLTLDTQRSTYYHMLITNRCMDYDFRDGMTLRDLYAYTKTVSPLRESHFGNQIGINGLILSSDGYVLMEKRDHNKTIWKNKFAQSISLALKEEDLTLQTDGTIGDTYECANENFKQIIFKTIRANFGLTAGELEEFRLEDNFLGLARDLLEGGKPNLFFYVTAKATAAELAKKLKENAAKTDEGALQTGKLSSDYYLVPFDKIRLNFQYVLKLDLKSCFKIFRRVYPRCSRRMYIWDRLKFAVAKKFRPVLSRECGEALLVTISYLELCKARIEALKDK